MKKIILIAVLTSLVSPSFANIDKYKTNSSASGNPELNNYYNHSNLPDNLPKPGDGIKIISKVKMGLDAKEDKDFTASNQEFKVNGYVKKPSDDARQLLSYGKKSFLLKDKKFYYGSNDAADTHIKKEINQIKLAFDYHPITFIMPENVIGFAAADGWIKFPNEGWTAVAEYFNDPDIGICDYLKSNAKLNQSAVFINQEAAKRSVNNKITTEWSEGNEETGYTYFVRWYEDEYYHSLKCSSKEFNKKSLQKTIELAVKIDLDQK